MVTAESSLPWQGQSLPHVAELQDKRRCSAAGFEGAHASNQPLAEAPGGRALQARGLFRQVDGRKVPGLIY
ncbi:unnamed protein product [Durusdinium trenchii]|uniref:Uncharacterized protein n=1 Tax=Durusdinium trenchii TaxID=1381693 RepID=A0ABP0J0E5_9DINO